jgi:hypothetical protein
MEVVIDYEFLLGAHNETIVKEISLAAEDVIQTYQFQSPYAMRPNGFKESGINWDVGHILHTQLYTVLSKAVAQFLHLYVYGDFIANLLQNCWAVQFKF